MPVKKISRAKVYKQVKNLAKKLKIPPDNYKSLYRKSTTAFWKGEREKLKNAYINQLRFTKLKDPTLLDNIRLQGYVTEKSTMQQGTLKVKSRVHTVPESLQVGLTEQYAGFMKKFEIEKQIMKLINPVKSENKTMHRITVESIDGKFISTPVLRKGWLGTLDYFIRNYVQPRSSAYEFESFVIKKITLSNISSSLMFGYSRSIKQAHEKWHVFDPVDARTNCMFQSIAVCRNWKSNPALLKDLSKLSQSGMSLKKYVKPTQKNGGDESTLQEICNYTKVPIKLYNNIFEEVKHFEPSEYNYRKDKKGKFVLNKKKEKIKYFKDDIPLYEVQKVGNHCVALLSRKEINKVMPEFKNHDIQPAKNEPNTQDRLISKVRSKRVAHAFNEKIASWDIETSKDSNNRHVPYACSVCWMEGKEQAEKQFWGLGCLVEFLKFIYKDEKFNGYTFYAHNGGKYDINLLVKYALMQQGTWKVSGSKCVELNNAWIGFEICDSQDPEHKISFRDSFRILPMGLEKLCKELNTKHQKLTETVKHSEITLQNYETFPQLKQYLSHDVRGLLEAMIIFNKSVFDELGIDVTKCMTGAGLSKSTFFRKYYNEFKYPVFTLSDEHDKFIRNGYFGGRNECFHLGALPKKIYYYDFTSLYPDVGRCLLPYGRPEEVPLSGCSTLPKGFYGFVKCLARTKDKSAIPKHALIRDGRLTFPVLENWTEVSCFSAEIDYDIYEYKFEQGLQFKKACFMSRFFIDGFEKKASAKGEGKAAMAQCWKIIINSGYGFWGLRTKQRDGVIISEKGSHDYMQYLNTESLISFNEHSDGSMYCRVLKDLPTKDFNVGVASAISSYARLKLWRLLTSIRKVGGEIYYCDTDSVICNINLNDYPGIKQEFQWDGNGSELGSLKNECDEVLEKKLKKLYPNDKAKQQKVYKKLVEGENGSLSFDEGLIEGCKQYGLKKTIIVEGKEHVLDILKLKGYSKSDRALEYSDFESMEQGLEVQQQQFQFRCPKSNYVSETEPFTIQTQVVAKCFRKTYSKGTVYADGTVRPHRI